MLFTSASAAPALPTLTQGHPFRAPADPTPRGWIHTVSVCEAGRRDTGGEGRQELALAALLVHALLAQGPGDPNLLDVPRGSPPQVGALLRLTETSCPPGTS